MIYLKLARRFCCCSYYSTATTGYQMAAWDLVFLGTGSAYPSPHRGASCAVLRHELGCWVFDCGEGSQIQFMKSSLRPGKITKIFITHLHGDHVFGLPGLLCTLSASLTEESPPVELYGPVGLRQFVRVALNIARSQLCYPYVVHELAHSINPADYDGLTDWCPTVVATGQPHPKELPGRTIERNQLGFWDICRQGQLSVQAATLKHRIASFGYVVVEDPLPGKLLVDKLKSLGVSPGPLYAKLKKGESIVSPQGTKIEACEVVGPSRPGRKVVVLGDTCDNSDIAPLCRGADVLVHESTNENSHQKQCVENGHSTPGMAANFCHSVEASQLILTHFSQRYRSASDAGDSDDPTTDKLVEEARDTLNKLGDTTTLVSAADDFRVYQIIAKK